MEVRSILFLTLVLACGAAHAASDSPPAKALSDYVEAPDPTFAWQIHAHYSVPGAEVVELHLHSQTWQDVLWKHQLYLIKPDGIDAAVRQGMLVIAGGRWRDGYESAPPPELPPDSAVFIELAKRLGTVVAVLGQVPFQPMFGLREDDLIAYSFAQYLKTHDSDWPLLLPMVKAAVKGMDAVQSFTADEWGVHLDRFTVLGGSKRGWTTWLTGAVDSRAATLVPIVIDVLNFKAQLPHQTAFWGAPSQALAPYTKRGLLEVLSSAQGADLRRIVDPYSYRKQLTQPKLIIVGTNDAYFPIDALNLYWNGLRGPKYVLYVPNNGHDINDYGRVIPTVVAANAPGEGGPALPDLSWQYAGSGTTLRLCARSDPSPAGMVLWSAESEDSDFRDAHFSSQPVAAENDEHLSSKSAAADDDEPSSSGPAAADDDEPSSFETVAADDDGSFSSGPGAADDDESSSSEPASADNDVYVARIPPPASGFKAVFGEVAFGQGEKRYTLSTNLRVIDSSGRPPAFSAAVDGDPDVCP